MKKKKTAIVLFNLGGPSDRKAIKPFLFNFFMDKNIIAAPKPIRYLLATYISRKRSRKEAGDSYALLGNRSPLLENTQKQSHALEEKLSSLSQESQFKTFVCMRYWHPMADEVVIDVKNWNPDKIILLPLYPQFSTTTTGSSFEVWEEKTKEHGLLKPTRSICCYPWQDGFVKASANQIKKAYNAFPEEQKPRVLFSAHGLPEKIIRDGDPYQFQCEQTAQKIAEEMNIDNLDWQICYQSRVGPLRWIGPSTEDALKKAARDQMPVLIYPHAFVSEHVETLVEIEIEYRELAETLGVPGFDRVPTVSTQKEFIEGLATMVLESQNKEGLASNENRPLCPQTCNRCLMNQKIKRAA